MGATEKHIVMVTLRMPGTRRTWPRTTGKELLAGTIEATDKKALLSSWQRSSASTKSTGGSSSPWRTAPSRRGAMQKGGAPIKDLLPDEASRMAAREQTDCYLE